MLSPKLVSGFVWACAFYGYSGNALILCVVVLLGILIGIGYWQDTRGS